MLKSFRFGWWLTKAFLLRHGKTISWTVGISIISALIILKTLPKILLVLKTSRQSSVIALVGKVRPEELPADILNKLSSGLTLIDESGRTIPGLAKSWDISEDGKSYSFNLDKSKIWHDGSPIVSKNINISIEHVTTDVLDESTVKFILEEPYAPFPTVLAKPLFKNRLIGTGKFRLKKLSLNGEFVDNVSIQNESSVETFKFYSSSADAITALKLGEVNEIRNLVSIDDVPKWDQLGIKQEKHLDRYLAVLFNTQDKFLAEKSVRQALSYAIKNKPQDEDRVISPISKSSWAYNPNVKPYNFDLQQAKELLKGMTEEVNSAQLEITTFLPYLNEAEKIAASWTELGIKTTVKVTLVLPAEFQILVSGQIIPPDPDQYVFWHSTQSTNLAKYANPKVDKLLEDGRKTLDENKRQEIYRDFQRFLLEDPPAVFIRHITTYSVYRK
jgi:peptide/nickel transport system substrate-binding protein